MALTVEEKVLQAGILAEKTDETTNPNMVYSSMASKSTGLNPDYFTGYNTKVVSAINLCYKNADQAKTNVNNFSSKINEILLDTSGETGSAKLEQLRTNMGQQTLIEGLIDLYENKLPTYATNDSIEYASAQELVDMYNALDTTEPTTTEETQ